MTDDEHREELPAVSVISVRTQEDVIEGLLAAARWAYLAADPDADRSREEDAVADF